VFLSEASGAFLAEAGFAYLPDGAEEGDLVGRYYTVRDALGDGWFTWIGLS
jgi:hypothetical protein